MNLIRIICIVLIFSESVNCQIYHCDAKGLLASVNVTENDLDQSLANNLKVPIFFHSIESREQTYFLDLLVELENRFDGIFKFSLEGYSKIENANQFPWRESTFSQNNNRKECLNIYLISDEIGPKGMASFPGSSESYVFVNQNDFSLTKLDINNLIHEIGHFFGLLHTFSHYFGRELVNGTNALEAGDLLSDTPAEYNTIDIKMYTSVLNKRMNIGATDLTMKTILLDGCQKISLPNNNLSKYRLSYVDQGEWMEFPVKDQNGESYGNLPNNYMSYVTKGCVNHQYFFTLGQKKRMRHFYFLYREKEFFPNKTEEPDPELPIGINPIKEETLYKRVNKKTISKETTEYDGLYFKDSDGYKEILYNRAKEAHYVYNGNAMAWNYPKIFFLEEAELTQLNSIPQKLKLVGSLFTDQSLNDIQISPLDHFESYPGRMMHALKAVWRNGENIFIPLYDVKEMGFKNINFKKRQVSSNEYEILITDTLKASKVYVIHSKKHFWIFKIK